MQGQGTPYGQGCPHVVGDVTHTPIVKWAVGLQMKGFLVCFFSVSISLKILHLGANSEETEEGNTNKFLKFSKLQCFFKIIGSCLLFVLLC